jgi:hypothetical protein
MRYTKAGEALTIAEAERRALIYMMSRPVGQPMSPSWIGQAIWPKNTMRSQGLGGAACRILAGLTKKGYVRQTHDKKFEFYGYSLTGSGRVLAQSHIEHGCDDCRAAKMHAYSDATTPGFFYTACSKHRISGEPV